MNFEDRQWISVSCSSYNLVNVEEFHSGIPKLFDENFYQSIKLHIFYFSLADINLRAVKILFSIDLSSINAPKSSSDEASWHL